MAPSRFYHWAQVIWCDLAFWKDPKKLALTACACLNAWPENATPRIVSGGVVTAAGHVYPFNYGLVSCRVHDYGLPPDCNGTLASVPDWCAQTWCYVNEECDAEDKTASRTLISGQSLFFSSQPCGQAVGATQSRTRSN